VQSSKLLARIVGTAVDLFYRRQVISKADAVPRSGPILLVANHHNGLVDPVVVQNTTLQVGGRLVRMLAKSTLFEMPGISVLMRTAQAIPVYRSKDGADTKQNAKTFEAVEQALVQGSAVLIFPEGISHDEPSLQPLKTGAARMALAALESGATDLVVLPLGLSYEDKQTFRSSVAVEVGTAIAVKDFAVPSGSSEEESRAAVKQLTAAIAERLGAITLNLQAWEDLPMLEAVDAIWLLKDPERARRLKSLARAATRLRQADPHSLDSLRERLAAWVARLASLGLKPGDLAEGAIEGRRSPKRVARFVALNLAEVLVKFPPALFGAVFWFVPFWTVHTVYLINKPEPDVGATVKLLASLVFYPLWYVGALLYLAQSLSLPHLLLVALTAPVGGMLTRHFIRRRFEALHKIAIFFKLGLQGQLVTELLAQRDQFCLEFDQLHATNESLKNG
jgi:glycerol-3-phosphate O-acyltransferase / dihydroxyacetone phosphate acyltransferase